MLDRKGIYFIPGILWEPFQPGYQDDECSGGTYDDRVDEYAQCLDEALNRGMGTGCGCSGVRRAAHGPPRWRRARA